MLSLHPQLQTNSNRLPNHEPHTDYSPPAVSTCTKQIANEGFCLCKTLSLLSLLYNTIQLRLDNRDSQVTPKNHLYSILIINFYFRCVEDHTSVSLIKINHFACSVNFYMYSNARTCCLFNIRSHIHPRLN